MVVGVDETRQMHSSLGFVLLKRPHHLNANVRHVIGPLQHVHAAHAEG